MCLLVAPPLKAQSFDVKTQPIRVEAARFERYDWGTKANVVLSGPAFSRMTGYGNWKILEARDDQGSDLRLGKDDNGAENAAIEPIQMAEARDRVGARGKIDLLRPSPKAKRVVRLRGTFSFYTGDTPLVVTIPHIKNYIGKTLSSPTLSAANVQISVDPLDEKGSNALGVRVRGDVWALQEGAPGQFFEGVAVTDSKSDNLVIGLSISNYPRRQEKLIFVSARRPIDDSMTLRVRLLAHSKSVTVPFELHDVPLPSTAQMKLDNALVEAADRDDKGDSFDPSVRPQIQSLLARGASVNARDEEGQTALFSAARAGDVELTQFLLNHGANPRLNDTLLGSSPLTDALWFEGGKKKEANHRVAMLLLAWGADVNACRKDVGTPLHRAAFSRDLVALRTLLSKGANINVQTNDGETPLTLAVESPSEEGVKQLLDAGANPNLRRDDSSNYGRVTALMGAIFLTNIKMTEMLLTHGADPNIANEKGGTALIQLAQAPYFTPDTLGVARTLIAHGANVNARTKNGNTALKWAKARGNPAFIHLLQEAGGEN